MLCGSITIRDQVAKQEIVRGAFFIHLDTSLLLVVYWNQMDKASEQNVLLTDNGTQQFGNKSQ